MISKECRQIAEDINLAMGWARTAEERLADLDRRKYSFEAKEKEWALELLNASLHKAAPYISLDVEAKTIRRAISAAERNDFPVALIAAWDFRVNVFDEMLQKVVECECKKRT